MRLTCKSQRPLPSNIFDFNHIDPDPPKETLEMLKRFFTFYHRKHWCYAELFRSFRRKNLVCNLAAGKLIVTSPEGSL